MKLFDDVCGPVSLEEAMEWTDVTLSYIRNGGSWIIPRSSSAYRIQHDTKTAVLYDGNGDVPAEYVLKKLGWKVEKEKDDGKKNTMES